MQSTTNRYLQKLDHLRGLAALLVISWHWLPSRVWEAEPTLPLSLFYAGYTSVTLFIVLSGFIFSWLSYGHRVHYRRFLLNRIVRIYPLFLFFLAIFISIGQLDLQRSGLSALLLFWNSGASPPFIGDFGPTWTLVVEFQFYLVFPFLHHFTDKYGVRYLLAFIALMVLVRLAIWVNYGSVQIAAYQTIVGRLDQFMIGMIAGRIYAAQRYKAARWHALAVLAAIIISLYFFSVSGGFYHRGSYPTPSPVWVLWPTFEAVLWAWLLLAYVTAEFHVWRPLNVLLAWWGTVSFSLYLAHQFLLHFIRQAMTGLHFPAFLMNSLPGEIIIVIPLLTGVASMTYLLIEKPFLSYRHNYLA